MSELEGASRNKAASPAEMWSVSYHHVTVEGVEEGFLFLH